MLSRMHAALTNSSGRDLSIMWTEADIPSLEELSPAGALRLYGLRMLSKYASQLRIFRYHTPFDYSADFFLMLMESLGATPRLRELFLYTLTTVGRHPTPSAFDLLPVLPNDLTSHSVRHKAGIAKLRIELGMGYRLDECIIRVLSTCIDAIGDVKLRFYPLYDPHQNPLEGVHAWSTVESILRHLPSVSSLTLALPNAEFEEVIPNWKSPIRFPVLHKLSVQANSRHQLGFLSKLEVPTLTRLEVQNYQRGPQVLHNILRGEPPLVFSNLRFLLIRGTANWIVEFLRAVTFAYHCLAYEEQQIG